VCGCGRLIPLIFDYLINISNTLIVKILFVNLLDFFTYNLLKMAASQEHIEDEGFQALLKPIQDLTKNCDIDLSQHLGEYLNYIREICGNNPAGINFAQAGVLLQNSTSIYCKKVDILHHCVTTLIQDLCKKQTDANKKNQDDGPTAGRRRRAAIGLDTDEFLLLDDIVSDRCITIDMEKERQKIAERKKEKIVLNAATKVKAKDKTSCNTYNYKNEILGKKDEFRLNWRICSNGTLHEEFINKKSVFQQMNPLDITVENEPIDNSCHDFGDDDPPASEPDLPPPSDDKPDLATSVVGVVPPDRESELLAIREANINTRKENIVEEKDVKRIIEDPWKPNDENNELVKKPPKQRKVTKIPPGLDNDKKRKQYTFSVILSYTIADTLMEHLHSKNLSFLRDEEFGFQSRLALRRKRMMTMSERAKYQERMVAEAAREQEEDFHGFYNEDVDSDHDLDFEGFDNDEGPDIEVPLPDPSNILAGEMENQRWMNEKDQELAKTMAAYAEERRKRTHDHNYKSELAKRVDEWHQKIAPKLEAAEERSSFDIHEYGTKILNTFNGEIGSKKQFAEIVAGEPREEVARYFLSSLMLANQYNVEISESEAGDLNTDCVQLQLLSLTRHHEEMDDNIRQTSKK